jgi:polar amino acid transport system substrate-binding protein
LRVAFLAGPLYATQSAAGTYEGVAVDLGRSLAKRLDVPMRTVVYRSPADVLAGAKSGEWDVAFMGASPDRAAVVDFTAPYMDVEQGYLVRAGVPIESAAGIDRAGVRIGVIERSAADASLSGSLKHATLIRVRGTGDLDALIAAGGVEAIAATKAFLYGRLAERPGARVLEGRLLVEPIAMAVPKGRDAAGAAVAARYVEDAKRSGEVEAAIRKAGLRGVVVAPPK